jgi:DnaJ-class molecular chaperone
MRAHHGAIVRVSRNLMLSQRTEDRLGQLAAATGITRGRIVDLALACVDLCEACQGEGVDVDGLVCPECRGTQIVPCGVSE